MGGSPRNLKTKVLSHILQAMVLEKWPSIQSHFISPTLKLKDCPIPFKERNYKTNKSYAIEKTVELLKMHPPIAFEGSKRDDLADAFLQGFYVCSLVSKGAMTLGPSEVVAKKAPKKTTTPAAKNKKRKAETAAIVDDD